MKRNRKDNQKSAKETIPKYELFIRFCEKNLKDRITNNEIKIHKMSSFGSRQKEVYSDEIHMIILDDKYHYDNLETLLFDKFRNLYDMYHNFIIEEVNKDKKRELDLITGEEIHRGVINFGGGIVGNINGRLIDPLNDVFINIQR